MTELELVIHCASCHKDVKTSIKTYVEYIEMYGEYAVVGVGIDAACQECGKNLSSASVRADLDI